MNNIMIYRNFAIVKSEVGDYYRLINMKENRVLKVATATVELAKSFIDKAYELNYVFTEDQYEVF